MVADRHCVRDASALRVAGRGHFRFDLGLRAALDEAIGAAQLAEVVRQGADTLSRSWSLAISVTEGEIDRLPPEGISFLVERYVPEATTSGEAVRRQALKDAFTAQTRQALEKDLAELREAPDQSAARLLLMRIRNQIEPLPGDRGKLGRVLLAGPLFIPASIGAEMAEREAMSRQMIIDFQAAVEYRPEHIEKIADASVLERADAAQLARWFAPSLIQQVDRTASYPDSEDRIGRVYLTGTPAHPEVHVDIQKPVIYWRMQEARIRASAYKQLVYVTWYPSRPALKLNDPEAGRIDGLIVRITLDRHCRPAIYEFVRSCGCYHTLWVAEFVEAAARRQFGPPQKGAEYAIRQPVSPQGLFLPELVRDDGARPRRAHVYVSAGHHFMVGVKPADDPVVEAFVTATQTYDLEPYDTLTRLPQGSGVASMFGSDGLVHDAGRGEGWLLAPTGMLSAGQPRQLGTIKIRMDAYDFDDPRLIEKNLRLPDDF